MQRRLLPPEMLTFDTSTSLDVNCLLVILLFVAPSAAAAFNPDGNPNKNIQTRLRKTPTTPNSHDTSQNTNSSKHKKSGAIANELPNFDLKIQQDYPDI